MHDDQAKTQNPDPVASVFDFTSEDGYRLQVTRTDKPFKSDHYHGQLRLTHVASGTVLLDEEVGLSYGAIFGPDAGDLDQWFERADQAIDEFEAKEKKH